MCVVGLPAVVAVGHRDLVVHTNFVVATALPARSTDATEAASDEFTFRGSATIFIDTCVLDGTHRTRPSFLASHYFLAVFLEF